MSRFEMYCLHALILGLCVLLWSGIVIGAIKLIAFALG
jgi:hypothetical protein